jgi:hypothetical protein
MTQANETEPVTGETQAPEMVRVEEAADADLDAFLADPKNFDTEAEPQPARQEETESRETSSASEPAKPEAPKEDASQEVTREEFNKQQRQLEGLELVVKRRTSELGDVKQRLQNLIAERSKGLEEKYQADPLGATNDIAEIRDAQKSLEAIKNEESELREVHTNQAQVLQHVNLQETPLTEMGKALLIDGVNPDFVDNFIRNPWKVPAFATIQLSRRVRAEKYLKALVPAYKELRDENAKLKRGGNDVLRQVDKAARDLPGITGKNGGAALTAEEDLSNIPVHKMTDAQLDAVVRKGGRK